ncbi:MAG: hypothetical protein JW863_04990 [Chitinispirillaceae bacterium]|nr:hypothetical protein [Chitinispirillaceae bacterium]
MHIQSDTVFFAEYLKKLPPAWVIDHFFSDTSGKRKILSSAMIEEVATESARPEALCRRFRSLDEENRLRCAVMYLCGGTGCAAVSAAGLDDPVVAAFLGYAARGPAGDVRIFGFPEFTDALREELVGVFGTAAQKKSATHHTAVWPWRCSNDIALIASFAGKNLLMKKRSGKFGSVLMQQIKRLIHTADFYKNDDLEVITRMVCSFCTARDLFSEDEEMFRCRCSAIALWLGLPLEERTREVETWFLKNCGGWNISLLKHLCGETGEVWLPTSVFPEEDQSTIREVLATLRFAGILEVRKHGTELCFTTVSQKQINTVPDAAPVVVMPDFTVILPQECLPETVYDAARFCRLESLDKVYHGTVDKGVVTEALAGGMKSERIIALLEEWNAPVNVLASVREWIREFFRVALSNGPLLITAEERVTGQIAAFPQLADYLEQIPVHAVFRIKPGTERQVTDLIRSLGFDERMPEIYSEQPSEEGFVLPFLQEPLQWRLVTENDPQSVAATPSFRGSKYGTGLKELDMSETVQVIDYAILTGQMLTFTYEGSPYVRKGTYTVTPVLCSKGGAEPLLDGQLKRLGTRKQFYIKKISSIGVVAK